MTFTDRAENGGDPRATQIDDTNPATTRRRGTSAPSLRLVSRRAMSRERAYFGTRPFALRRYGLHALIARLERASDGSAPPWRTSLPPPGPHRQGRHHGVGDEFEARAPDGADAREPSGQFARSEQPTGSTVALACADGVRRA
jgi:hypothetical protein